MNSRLANVLAVTAVGVVWFAGCSDDGASTEPAASSTATATTTTAAAVGTSGSPQWLYVMDATDGSGGDGAFTLRGVNPSVISFTDRPARVARRIAIEELVSSWADVGFSDDPPNASLVFERDGREQIQTVTLTNPRLEGDELTFSYTPLTDAAPVVVVGERTAELPAQFGTAALFIDASRSTVGASIGVGDAGAYIQFTPDVYDCPGNSDDDCWGVLLGQDMEPYAPWEVFYMGESSPIVTGTADIDGNLDLLEINLKCGPTAETAYIVETADSISTESNPTVEDC